MIELAIYWGIDPAEAWIRTARAENDSQRARWSGGLGFSGNPTYPVNDVDIDVQEAFTFRWVHVLGVCRHNLPEAKIVMPPKSQEKQARR